MRIIISPAKTMNIHTDVSRTCGTPVFLLKTDQIIEMVRTLSFEECKKLWGCNDALVTLNMDRFQNIDHKTELTPAILSYEGIQYQYMTNQNLSDDEYTYLEEHLRILSGLYGVLKPFDGIQPYRMEMQAKLSVGGHKDLYSYWNNDLYREVMDDSHIIINLASKEYSKCIEKYLTNEDHMITIIFAELQNDKVKQKATLAKMARGEMVRYMASHRITDPEGIRNFTGLNFRYNEELSNENEYVFIRSSES